MKVEDAFVCLIRCSRGWLKEDYTENKEGILTDHL